MQADWTTARLRIEEHIILVAQRDRRIRSLMLWRLVLLALLVVAVTWHLYKCGC